jgi:hypothetical protein
MDEPQQQNPRQNWRLGAAIGLGIVVAMWSSKFAEKSLTPSLGEWGAFGVSLLLALVAAGAIGLGATVLFRK